MLQVFVLGVLLAVAPRAETSLESARHARDLLGPDVWSRIIMVRNETHGGRYPRVVHALVFELAGILWFYTDVDGTQSFSLHRGRLEEEKRDFGPLLRDIEPGFVHWSTAEDLWPATARSGEPLRNGCFIDSIAALRARVARGQRTEKPRLLSYYIDTTLGRRGHTVLTYRVGETIEVFDPARPGMRFVFPTPVDGDPRVLARALEERDIQKARFVVLGDDGAGAATIASSAQSRRPLKGEIEAGG